MNSISPPGDANRESGESSGCLLVLAWVACLITTILFLVSACTTNIGLLVFASPSIPFLMFTFGGFYGLIISLLGAYMLCSAKYDLLYCKTTIVDCCLWPCTPHDRDYYYGVTTKPKRREEYSSSIRITGLTVVLSQIFVCACIAFFTMTICIGRSSESSATRMLSQRWKTLSLSQDGYAILIQNQDEFKCCGYLNDNDWPAQPCGLDKDDPSGGVGTLLPGCEKALILANGEMMKTIAIGNAFVWVLMCLSLYFGWKARTIQLDLIEGVRGDV